MRVILFGNGKFASLAWYCLTHDGAHDVAAFTVDAPYLTDPTLHGRPVVDFARVEERFPATRYHMLVHVGGSGMNALRAERCASARAKGYQLPRYVSSRALTWPDLRLGWNCFIYDGATVEPFVTIGDDVIVRSGAHLSHHVSIGDHAFIAARACVGGGATVGNGCFVGLNATIRDGVNVAEGCLVAAGAVVTADTEPDGLYVGVPARRAAPASMRPA